MSDGQKVPSLRAKEIAFFVSHNHKARQAEAILSSGVRMEEMERRYPEPTVGALIVNDENQILLARSVKWKDRFTLPGGHIELGETIEQALKREIMEEVGLKVEPVRLLLLQEAIYSEEFFKPKHFIFLDYLCKAETTEVEVDHEEIQECVWVDPRKALEMNVDTFTRQTISKYLNSLQK